MAITCPACGREYDVTLFQLGRTIHCTCGRRVGLEHRVTVPISGGEPRFIGDAMLGRLARWLRTLGYDTAHDDAIADADLVRRAFEEARHILTRDRGIFEEWCVAGGLLLESDATLDQLHEVVSAFDLEPPERLFTRCRVCNGVLERVTLEQVADRLPEGVRARGPTLTACPDCGRVYWEGSHTDRMRALVGKIFDRP